MKFIILIYFFLLPLGKSFSQNNQINYDFINSFLNEFRQQRGLDTLQIENTANPCDIKDSEFEYYWKELKGKINKKSLRELFENKNKEFEYATKWNDSMLNKVIIVPSEQVESLFRVNRINIKIAEMNWLKYYHADTLSEEAQSGFLLDHDKTLKSIDEFDTLVNEHKKYLWIMSLPTFDNNKEYVLIDFGGGKSRSTMYGTHYLFRRINHKWEFIAKVNSWVT